MTSLVDDLLDVSRVTRGLVVLDKEALDLRSVVAAAIEQVQPLIEARRHRLTVHLPDDPAPVLGDHTRLVQVIVNLPLDRARIETPRVRVLDIGLPDMDGCELARRLRTPPELAGAVLIALTGYGRAEDYARSKAAGFNYHFVKPADTTKLAALIAEIGSAN